MKAAELKAERIRQEKSIDYMAALIGKSPNAYAKKEKGTIKFSPEEITAISNDLHLDVEKINLIFFDDELQIKKEQEE